jgi:hypothetical protein
MSTAVDRRTFLRGLAALPFGAALPPLRRDAPALILVWLDGGMSHIDTFDGKPEAPPDIRGDLASIRGAVDGTFVSAHLPQIAARLDRASLIRSISHGEGNHDRGSHLLLTGSRISPVLVPPALGAVASLRRPSPGALPSYVAIPDAPDFGGAGFLPAEHGPFAVGGDPSRPDFRVRDLLPGAAAERTAAMLAALDALDGGPRSAGERARDRFVADARAIGLAPELRSVFDLSREPAARRERYGRHRLGQSCLLAARLARAGSRVVVCRDPGWDHHQGIARALTFGYPPKLEALDQAVSALLDDLRDGPLAGRAVVLVASEFGRTPRLNPSGGRDHWPRAQSVLLAGAGVAEGVVVGRTDERGEEPVAEPRSPADLFATLCALCAIPTAPLETPDGRPVRLVAEGATAISEVLG